MNIKTLVFSLLFIPGTLLAQDAEYSQFFANPLHLNPALTGTSELPRAIASYRKQWPQNGNSYNTYSLSYDCLLKKQKAGVGFQLNYDSQPGNYINSSSASASYSYHLELGSESFMTLGLDAGFVIKQYNTGELIFPSEINQQTGTITQSTTITISNEKRLYPDFAVGLVGQHSGFFWGASIHHLTQPNESIIDDSQNVELPMKFTAHAGARTHKFHHGLLSRRFTVSPNILYQQQGSFKQLNLGIYMIEKSFLFGGWFRNNIDERPDAIIALIGLAREKFKFGYSFDYTLSELSYYSHGTHEISLTFFLKNQGSSPIRNRLLIPMI